MAGKYDEYEKILYGNKSSGSSALATNQGKIANYQARLAASGVNPEEATDTRNSLEKALNLRQNQNFLFDIFEILNRPQQALFGGIENMQQGGDFLEGAKQGITGDKQTQFKDILMNTGMFNDTTYEDLVKQGESGGLGTKLKAIDLVDLLGFGGDVFLDPMDIPLIPVSAASKGAKAVDAVTDVAKAADIADTASDIAKATEFISPTQAIGRAAKSGIKGAVNLADTGIEKALTKLDETKGIKYISPESKWASELGKVGDDVGKLEIYKGLKNNLTTMFNTKLSKTARDTQKLNEAKEAISRVWLEDNYNKINGVLDNTATKLGKTVEEVNKDINKIIDVVDDINMSKVIDGAKDGTIKYTNEIYKNLVDIAKDVPDSSDILINSIKKGKDGVLELGEEWEKAIDKFDLEKLDKQVKRASFLSQAEQKEIANLTKFYEQNAPEAVQAVRDFYNEGNKFISEQFSSMEGLGEKFLQDNLEGYSKHKLADDYAENVRKLSDYGVNLNDIQEQLPQGYSGVGTGARTLNTRKYSMSAQEANLLKQRELMNLPGLSDEGKRFIKDNIKLFDVDATAGLQEYINQMPKYAKNTQMIDEVMMKQGFGDLKEMSNLKRAIKEGKDVAGNTEKLNKLLDNSPFRLVEGGKTPYGFKKLDTDTKNYLVNFLRSTGKKTGNDELIKMAGQLNKLDNMAVDPTVLNIIKLNTDTMKKNEFGKLYNNLMGFFKKNSTASLTNQMNNITGNISNMAMAGMDVPDIAKYSSQAVKDLNNWEDILKRGVADLSQLSDDEVRIYNNLKGFMENVGLPDKNAILKKYDIDGVMKAIDTKGNKNLYDKYVDFFATLNANEDRVFKYALYTKAMDDPKFVKNLGIESVDELGRALTKEQMAGRAVNKALFDPSDLTAFEQGTMKNIIPFYTFTKKNLAYQISNMGDNLQNYNKLMKGYNSILNSFDGNEENIADYLKENMYIPIPGLDKDGNYTFLRAQLPFGDLTDVVSDPLGSLVNRGNPFVKALYENVANVNTLTGNKIEKYPGQKGNINILNDIPIIKDTPLSTAKFQQSVGNITGLNTLLRQIDRSYKGYQEGGIPGILTNNATITGNVDTDKLSKTYSQIEELQNIMKQYEQKGYQFSTLNELKKANKNGTLEGINAIFAKYGISDNSSSKSSPYSDYEKILYGR